MWNRIYTGQAINAGPSPTVYEQASISSSSPDDACHPPTAATAGSDAATNADDKPCPISKLLLLNARSLSPAATGSARWKIPHIQDNLIGSSDIPIPIMGITETWLKPYIKDPQVSIKGYKCLRSDREKRKGGGSILYIHESLLISDEECYADKYTNMICCYMDSMDMIIGSIYRPPDAPLSSFTATL